MRVPCEDPLERYLGDRLHGGFPLRNCEVAMSFTIYFDLETGGVEPKRPNIQLAAIAVRDSDWVEVANFEAKIQFNEAEADPEALRLNHYSRESWEDAKPSLRVAQEFLQWAEPHRSVKMVSKAGKPYQVAKLAGHNASTFDLPRLRSMMMGAFFPFSFFAKDTLQRALWFFDEHPGLPRPESLKLGVLCKYFGIESDGAHDALVDVRLCAALARAMALAEVTA